MARLSMTAEELATVTQWEVECNAWLADPENDADPRRDYAQGCADLCAFLISKNDKNVRRSQLSALQDAALSEIVSSVDASPGPAAHQWAVRDGSLRILEIS